MEKCVKCGKEIKSEKVVEFSRQRFDDEVFCFECQKLKKAEKPTIVLPVSKPSGDGMRIGLALKESNLMYLQQNRGVTFTKEEWALDIADATVVLLAAMDSKGLN